MLLIVSVNIGPAVPVPINPSHTRIVPTKGNEPGDTPANVKLLLLLLQVEIVCPPACALYGVPFKDTLNTGRGFTVRFNVSV